MCMITLRQRSLTLKYHLLRIISVGVVTPLWTWKSHSGNKASGFFQVMNVLQSCLFLVVRCYWCWLVSSVLLTSLSTKVLTPAWIFIKHNRLISIAFTQHRFHLARCRVGTKPSLASCSWTKLQKSRHNSSVLASDTKHEPSSARRKYPLVFSFLFVSSKCCLIYCECINVTWFENVACTISPTSPHTSPCHFFCQHTHSTD